MRKQNWDQTKGDFEYQFTDLRLNDVIKESFQGLEQGREVI